MCGDRFQAVFFHGGKTYATDVRYFTGFSHLSYEQLSSRVASLVRWEGGGPFRPRSFGASRVNSRRFCFKVRTTCSSNGYHYVDPSSVVGPGSYNHGGYGRECQPPDVVGQQQRRSPCYNNEGSTGASQNSWTPPPPIETTDCERLQRNPGQNREPCDPFETP